MPIWRAAAVAAAVEPLWMPKMEHLVTPRLVAVAATVQGCVLRIVPLVVAMD